MYVQLLAVVLRQLEQHTKEMFRLIKRQLTWNVVATNILQLKDSSVQIVKWPHFAWSREAKKKGNVIGHHHSGVNVFWLISCCLQLCCKYAVHLRPLKLPQITRHTLCSCAERHWFNDRAPGVWRSRNKNLHKVSFGWITVVFFQFVLKKKTKEAKKKRKEKASVYLYVTGY